MKTIIGILIVAVTIVAVIILVQVVKNEKANAPGNTTRTGQAPPNVIAELRQKVFSASPQDLGLSPSQKRPNVWGVVMEIGFPDATATLFSLGEGTTNLYFSSGGGIIGGGQHETVRQKAEIFLDAAEHIFATLTLTKDYPLPKSGMIRFYVLSYSGVYMGEAPETEVTNSGSPLYPLFAAGNDVMTELRLIDQKNRPTSR